MTYQGDHLAWQQRCAQEFSRKTRFETDYRNRRIPPLTNAKYDINLMSSQYTNGYGTLLTLEQKRRLLAQQEAAMHQSFDFSGPADAEDEQYNPYMLKGEAKEEFGRSLESRGNYSFGGRTPLTDKRKNSALPSKYFVDNRGVMRMTAGSITTPSKSFKTFSGPINPFENIYELVQQEVDVPQGLLYRGKYCGKSKLRKKNEEFGEEASKKPRPGSGMGQVIQKSRRPGTAMQTVEPRRQQRLAYHADKMKSKMRAANTRNTELIRQMSKEDQMALTPNRLREMQKFYPEDYFKRSGYPMKSPKPQEYYEDAGVSFRRKEGRKITAEEYKRFNEDIEKIPNYHAKANKIPLKAGNVETLSQVSNVGKVLSQANLDKFSKAPSHMASTKSQGERNYAKSLVKSAFSGSRASAKSRTLKNVRSQRMIRNKNDTKTVKSIKTVKTADIVNLINGAKLSEKIQPNIAIDDQNIENKIDEALEEIVYFDEQTGLYYDKLGNLIDFNPDDYIIEEQAEEADGPQEVHVTLQATPSQLGVERALSTVSRPKSAVNRGQSSKKGGNRLAARRIYKIKKEQGKAIEKRDPSPPTQAESYVSGVSYISQLENDLDRERIARQRLEDDIVELKKMNQEISVKLGLDSQ